MRIQVALIGLAMMWGAGCAAPMTATVNGREVPRQTFAFAGKPYDMLHSRAHPEPGSPSSGLKDDGGHITGHVCGLEVMFDVRHNGDNVSLDGWVDNRAAARIEVKDEGGYRTFTGTLGTAVAWSGVELKMGRDGLVGRVGRRVFSLKQEGDKLEGQIRINDSRFAKATINGWDSLWALPAAAQASILPALLTCNGGFIENDVRNPLEITVGGEKGAVPAGSSALYLTPNGSN